jgi:hypothetical protein
LKLNLRFLFKPTFLILIVSFCCANLVCSDSGKIDRYSLVNRHNPVNKKIDPWSPFTVGNGGFAFTADITGLQTFSDYYYKNGIPLQIITDWCWHTFLPAGQTGPNPKNYQLKNAYKTYDVHGRKVEYPSNQNSDAGKWLRENPQRQPLGQIGFEFKKSDGSIVKVEDVKNISQKLDLWNGIIESSYQIDENIVKVNTICNPDEDVISVKVSTKLISEGKLRVNFKFPYSYVDSIKNDPPYDWSHQNLYTTKVINEGSNFALLERTIDTSVDTTSNGKYFVYVNWSGNLKFNKEDNHFYKLIPNQKENEFEFSFGFFKNEINKNIPTFNATKTQSEHYWKKFWSDGGAIDFSGSTDPRANELERRVILSQYLTSIQFAGDFPPQETGLTLSSWFGKHNTEMIWWHAAQFALWNRVSLLEKNLRWYIKTIPSAEATAKERGFEGARWSKMVGPEGRESPGNNPFIIWNEPHPIYLAELCYRAKHNQETLEKYKNLVFKTAEFLASYAYFDTAKKHYVLGPPVWPVQEIYDPVKAQNPSFELAYWKFSLEIAQRWRERLGMKKNLDWDDIINKISPLPIKDSLYVVLGSIPDTFTNPASEIDHPSMLMARGFLPGDMVNEKIMKKTLQKVIDTWDWNGKIWGWDYPMMAMTATRLNESETAVNILLKDAPNNHYLNNGNCPQREDLPVYLPANGALLSAVALMAAGSDETGSKKLPGFPNNGKWKVRFEYINKLP